MPISYEYVIKHRCDLEYAPYWKRCKKANQSPIPLKAEIIRQWNYYDPVCDQVNHSSYVLETHSSQDTCADVLSEIYGEINSIARNCVFYQVDHIS